MLAAASLARRLLAPTGAMLRPFASGAALIMHEFGAPEEVLKLADHALPNPESLGDNEVLINILAVSFINGRLSPLLPTVSLIFTLFIRPPSTRRTSTQSRASIRCILSSLRLLDTRVWAWWRRWGHG